MVPFVFLMLCSATGLFSETEAGYAIYCCLSLAVNNQDNV